MNAYSKYKEQIGSKHDKILTEVKYRSWIYW